MLLGLDHLVVAVLDPDAAAGELERAVGLRSTNGGRHPAWGTWNRLAWLGDTYVELIGLFDRSLAPNGPVSRVVAEAIDHGHVGLVAYSVATDDIDGDLARLRRSGSSLGDVEIRSRTRPDGEIVAWRASFPPALGPAEPPFVIEHELIGAEWGDTARTERAAFRHPLGAAARITALELPVPDVSASAAAYARVDGIEFEATGSAGLTTAGGAGASADVLADAGAAIAMIGPQSVRLTHGRPLHDLAVVEVGVAGLGAIAGGTRDVDALGVRWRISASG